MPFCLICLDINRNYVKICQKKWLGISFEMVCIKINFKNLNAIIMTLVKNKIRHNAFPVLFEDAFFRDLFDINPKTNQESFKSSPAVNVKETDAAFVVELAAPGLKKDDFKISVEKNILTISSEIKKEENTSDENGKYFRQEFSYSSFSRNFTLDEKTTDIENISASYEAGVLSLSIPKKVEEEKAKKLIEIQ